MNMEALFLSQYSLRTLISLSSKSTSSPIMATPSASAGMGLFEDIW